MDNLILLLLVIGIFYSAYKVLKPRIKRYQTNQWKNQPHIKKVHHIFVEIYQEVNGYFLSFKGRKQSGTDQIAWVYGEVDFYDFIKLLALVNPKPGSIFYDLGTGVGKVIVIAALLYPFKKCIGIELFKELSDAAQESLNHIQQNYRERLPNPNIQLEILRQDFLESDFSDADIVFINATCYVGETWQKIENRLEEQLHAGAKVIITSQKLTSSSFKLLEQQVFMMSWGYSVVSIYEKQLSPIMDEPPNSGRK